MVNSLTHAKNGCRLLKMTVIEAAAKIEEVKTSLYDSAGRRCKKESLSQDSKPPGKENYFEFYQQQLDKDSATLKAIESIADKISKKRELISFYQPLIKEVLADKTLKYPAILSQVMVWLFDIADIEPALKLAFLLNEKNVKLPSRFDCTLQTFIVRATCEWARPILKQELSASPYLDSVINEITQQSWDLLPQSASEIYVLQAKFQKNAKNWADVIKFVNMAEEANPDGFGAKTLRNEALKELKKI